MSEPTCHYIVTNDECSSFCRLAEARDEELFDLQWERTVEAADAWRAADPEARATVLPDLGELLTWLLDEMRMARDERNEVARAAACEFHTGPDAADDDIRGELISRWLAEGRDNAPGWREELIRATQKYVRAVKERDESRVRAEKAEQRLFMIAANLHDESRLTLDTWGDDVHKALAGRLREMAELCEQTITDAIAQQGEAT